MAESKNDSDKKILKNQIHSCIE